MLGTAPCVLCECAVTPEAARGAVMELPGGGGRGVLDAQGAFVGWFGPLGTVTGAPVGIRDEAQGAAVPPDGGIPPPLLHGARVLCAPGSDIGSRKGG